MWIIFILLVVVALVYYTFITKDMDWSNWNITPIYKNGRILTIILILAIMVNIVINKLLPWSYWLLIAEIIVAAILVTKGVLESNLSKKNVFLWLFIANLVITGIVVSSIEIYWWIWELT